MYKNIQPLKKSGTNFPLFIMAIAIHHNPVSYANPSGGRGYQWIYCTKGHGNLIVNHEKILLEKGYGYLLYPHISFEFYAVSKDWQLDFIEFDGSAGLAFLQALDMPQSSAYYFHDQTIFHKNIASIVRMFNKSPAPDELALSKALYNFLLDLPPAIHHVNRTDASIMLTRDNPVNQIIAYCESNLEKQFSLDELAAHVGLNKNYMCSLFKKTMKHTIITELTYIRIGLARIYLKQYPEKNVKDIAQMCGYEDAGYFGKVFKKIEGTSPEQYRRI